MIQFFLRVILDIYSLGDKRFSIEIESLRFFLLIPGSVKGKKNFTIYKNRYPYDKKKKIYYYLEVNFNGGWGYKKLRSIEELF